MNTFELDNKYIANTYNRFPLELVSGNGALAKDTHGREYIDMGSGIAVNIFGFCDKKWQDAVTEQINKLQHTSNLYYTKPCAKLAEMLCEKTGMKKVFFANSGAEANECAIKVARKYAEINKGAEYYTIITLKNSFHGRTLTTLAATGQDVFHKDFTPLTPGFVYADANDAEDVKRLVKENKVAAIMFECVQGEGGVNPLTKEFVSDLVEISEKENILLIADEVQTGNGRTGTLYAYMQYGFTPDIVTTAKGLGGGLPIGAAMLGKKVENIFSPGMHGSTFGGNPIAASGAISILERIDDKLLDEVKEKSDFIKRSLSVTPGIKSVTGLGLMLGIETEKPAGEVVKKCMDNGVLVLTAKTKVRLLPPLNIPMDLLKKAIEIIKSAVC